MSAPIPDWANQAAIALRSNSTDSVNDIAKTIAGAHRSATQTLTCVFCGQSYPPGTPTHGAQILTDHIRVCEKHPMRALEAANAKLRRALVGLVGVDTREELEGIEAIIRLAPIPDEDKANTLNGIHALRDTLPT